MKEFIKKLVKIQSELVAPKGQYNSYGKYKYRNCEDILAAVKPHLAEAGFVLTLSDEIIEIGGRFYVEATATITDGENSKSVKALAREEECKKGMDGAQVTGASSSYARKYSLNGLFGIDDTKDPDTKDNSGVGQKKADTSKYDCVTTVSGKEFGFKTVTKKDGTVKFMCIDIAADTVKSWYNSESEYLEAIEVAKSLNQ